MSDAGLTMIRGVAGLLVALSLLLADHKAFSAVLADADVRPPVLDVVVRKFVKKRVRIPGGHYAIPYIITQSATEYVLEGEVTAEGTAIAIRASKVVLNLNGKTITYNQVRPGEGITVDTYNHTDIAIINGRIVQGAALSEGDVHGAGNNPVKAFGMARLQIAGIHARYGGRDVCGFKVPYVTDSIIEFNRLEDTWSAGTLKNRHQGIDAIQATDARNLVRNNIIINARHRGIAIGDSGEVYGNVVHVNSLATNSVAIGGYRKKQVRVHGNEIVARGEHPIGIGFVSSGTDDIDIYNNTIDVQTTRLGDEYGGSAACMTPTTPCGNYAVGFRTTWGGNNIRFHGNSITVRTDSTYHGTHSVTGRPVVVNAKGRGLMVAVNEGEFSRFYDNTITVLDRDGSGKAFGIACTGGNAGTLIFEENTVTSNVLNVALGDEYGACGGHPLFVRNTFVRADGFPSYRTVASELGGYFEGTGRFVSNSYRDGASQQSIELNAGGKAGKSVYFGRELAVRLQSPDGLPLAGALVTLDNGGGIFDATAATAADGTARLVLYDYELHNRNSATEHSREIIAHNFRVTVENDTFACRPEANPAGWDALTLNP